MNCKMSDAITEALLQRNLRDHGDGKTYSETNENLIFFNIISSPNKCKRVG